jgi:hypothetical protein
VRIHIIIDIIDGNHFFSSVFSSPAALHWAIYHHPSHASPTNGVPVAGNTTCSSIGRDQPCQPSPFTFVPIVEDSTDNNSCASSLFSGRDSLLSITEKKLLQEEGKVVKKILQQK